MKQENVILPKVCLLNDIPTLFVDGKPFVALSGEVHNSSASDPSYMLKKVWPNISNYLNESGYIPRPLGRTN